MVYLPTILDFHLAFTIVYSSIRTTHWFIRKETAFIAACRCFAVLIQSFYHLLSGNNVISLIFAIIYIHKKHALTLCMKIDDCSSHTNLFILC